MDYFKIILLEILMLHSEVMFKHAAEIHSSKTSLFFQFILIIFSSFMIKY